MVTRADLRPADIDELEEVWEWIESFDAVVDQGRPDLATRILREIGQRAAARGVPVPFTANTPDVGTVPRGVEGPVAGDRELERKVKSRVRWNARGMVGGAN